MKTEEIAALNERYLMNTFPKDKLALVKGRGARVWDAEGGEYLDFLAGISVNNLGHCNEQIVEAVRRQVGELMHCTNLYYIEPTMRLAEMLCENCFADRVYFSNSGSEANETAMKLARKYAKENVGPERTDFIAFDNSFHGRTFATVSATGQPKYWEGFEPMFPGISHAKFNDLASVEALVTDKTAAILVEPVQGEGGFIFAEPEFLKGLRQLCDKRQIVLIFDEVQCGLGRLGTHFGYQHYGVEPDIMTLAKSLGGGLPMGATLARESIAAALTPGSHGGTMGGNPVVAAAALAYCEQLFTDDLMNNVVERGEQLRGRLENLKSRCPDAVRSVRGVGLMNAFDLASSSADFNKALERKGLLAGTLANDAIRFHPPLNVTAEEIDEACDIVERVVAEL